MFVRTKKLSVVLFGLVGMAVSTGCSKEPEITQADLAAIDFDAQLENCCTQSVELPNFVIGVADSSLNSIFPVARSIILRQSYLQNEPQAQALILGPARPLDLILIANHSRLTGATGQSFFGHNAIYTGDEADLRALGVWDHPAVARFHQRIRAGGVAIESIDEGVRLSNAHRLMEADSAALFHATGLSRARQREAIIYLFSEIGRPFDNHFNLETKDEIYCTELIHDALPELNMPVRISYNRRAIWPDEVATQSLLHKTGFRFHTFVHGTALGWSEQSWQRMAARILQTRS